MACSVCAGRDPTCSTCGGWADAGLRSLPFGLPPGVGPERGEITIGVSPFVRECLERLAALGLHGETVPEVVLHLVRVGLRAELVEGLLTDDPLKARDGGGGEDADR